MDQIGGTLMISRESEQPLWIATGAMTRVWEVK